MKLTTTKTTKNKFFFNLCMLFAMLFITSCKHDSLTWTNGVARVVITNTRTGESVGEIYDDNILKAHSSTISVSIMDADGNPLPVEYTIDSYNEALKARNGDVLHVLYVPVEHFRKEHQVMMVASFDNLEIMTLGATPYEFDYTLSRVGRGDHYLAVKGTFAEDDCALSELFNARIIIEE